jgi:anthranilate/para-aminobenzoate synthase component II
LGSLSTSCLALSFRSPFEACRYHSLVIKRETVPEDLEVTAWTEDGTIMAVRHKKYPHIQVLCRTVLGWLLLHRTSAQHQ